MHCIIVGIWAYLGKSEPCQVDYEVLAKGDI